ncbi:MAG: Twin-arginine translocation protein TatA [Labilithrix sp.]|nr:Twin-arginine translocation protein TatA [Labilithrix sp.]
MVDSALACGQCGAGLPPPDAAGNSACVYCGAEHRSPRSNGILTAALAERPSWHDCKDAARIPLTEDAVLDLLRQHFADVDSISVCPHVPPNREAAVRRAYAAHLPARERILALYETGRAINPIDTTLHEGFVVTAKRICWRNAFDAAHAIKWNDVDPDRLFLDDQRLFLGDEPHDAVVLAEPELQDACANAFHVLALSGLPPLSVASGLVAARDTRPDFDDSEQSGLVLRPPTLGSADTEAPASHHSATPPPPHTTSFFAYASHAQAQAPDCCCWHCHTPLYATTPQCAYCGAEPAPTGWLRTA